MPAKKAATKTTAKKTTAKKAAKKAVQSEAKPKAPAKKATVEKTEKAATVVTVPSTDAIARQAYLNYLHRVQNGLPGDAHGDWIAAEKQLSKS